MKKYSNPYPISKSAEKKGFFLPLSSPNSPSGCAGMEGTQRSSQHRSRLLHGEPALFHQLYRVSGKVVIWHGLLNALPFVLLKSAFSASLCFKCQPTNWIQPVLGKWIWNAFSWKMCLLKKFDSQCLCGKCCQCQEVAGGAASPVHYFNCL